MRDAAPCACRAGRCVRAVMVALGGRRCARPCSLHRQLGAPILGSSCSPDFCRAFWGTGGATEKSARPWGMREPIHALFAHGCCSCGRRSAAARPGAPLKNRPACAPQLCTVWRGRPVARAGSACVHVCSCPGNAIFEHVFRSCGCHRAAAGLGRSSKACTACAL